MASSNPSTNPFLEWLSTQWYFLTALAAGAFHAGISHFKINKHEEQFKELQELPEKLARIETDIRWLREHHERNGRR